MHVITLTTAIYSKRIHVAIVIQPESIDIGYGPLGVGATGPRYRSVGGQRCNVGLQASAATLGKLIISIEGCYVKEFVFISIL